MQGFIGRTVGQEVHRGKRKDCFWSRHLPSGGWTSRVSILKMIHQWPSGNFRWTVKMSPSWDRLKLISLGLLWGGAGGGASASNLGLFFLFFKSLSGSWFYRRLYTSYRLRVDILLFGFVCFVFFFENFLQVCLPGKNMPEVMLRWSYPIPLWTLNRPPLCVDIFLT